MGVGATRCENPAPSEQAGSWLCVGLLGFVVSSGVRGLLGRLGVIRRGRSQEAELGVLVGAVM